GGDTALEEKIYDPKYIEKVSVWGGYNAVKNITRFLQPGLEMIAWDPKLSSTLIGSEAFADEATMREVALRLAADIGFYNQVGCASARVVYAQSGTDAEGLKRANTFGRYVYEAMQNLPSDVSSPAKRFTPSLRAEIDALRLVGDDFNIIGGKDGEGAI